MNKDVKFIKSDICCIADLHFGVHQNNSMWHDIAMQWAVWLDKELKAKKIKDIFILGDFFHYRSEIAVNTIQFATDILNIWRDYNIVILIGNHDSYYKDRVDVNSLSLFDGWQNITIISEPTRVKSHGKELLICPWGTEPEELTQSDIIFGHFEIESFKMNQFKVCTAGAKSKDLLKNTDLVLTGHFHLREERQYNDGTILYVGNPYQMDFGDVGSTKGYYILDIKHKQHKFYENRLSPQHKKIYLSKLVQFPGITEEVKRMFNNNIVKLIIDKNISSDEIELLLTKFSELNAVSITTDYVVNFDRFGISDAEASNISGVDIPTAIEEFINLLEIDNKDSVINHTLELYKNCK